MRRATLVASTVAIVMVTLALGTATASAQGSAVTFKGTTRCTVTGRLTFTPALEGLDTGTSQARLSATLTHCTHAQHGGVTLTKGRLKGLGASITPDNCTNTAITQTPPPLSGGSVAWTPSSVTASGSISFPAGVASIVTNPEGVTFLQVAYAGGTVGSGSFTTATRAALTLTSTENDAQLESRCTSARGLGVVDFSGTATV
jgi:hypothetical protein